MHACQLCSSATIWSVFEDQTLCRTKLALISEYLSFAYVFWFWIIRETLGCDKENVRSWFAFLYIRVTRSHNFMMEQVEQLTMVRNFHFNRFLSTRCRQTDRDVVCMKMPQKTFSSYMVERDFVSSELKSTMNSNKVSKRP